jgi:uracil-DNA glycosylase
VLSDLNLRNVILDALTVTTWPGVHRPDPGWPRRAAEVADLAAGAGTLDELVARQSVCRARPRLVAWREEVAAVRRRSCRESPGDGQRSLDARMVAAVRCAPPANKPEPAERNACAPWLAAELRLVTADLRVIVCLGGFAWQAIWPVLGQCGFAQPRPRPRFGHGAEVRLTNQQAPGEVLLIGCYHPSQQSTFTGRVTPAMLDAIFTRARAHVAAGADAETDHPVT